MPIYEYACPKCGSSFEELKSVSDRENPSPCPNCGEKKPGRKVSTVNGLTSSGPSGARASSGTCSPRRGFT